MTRMPSTGKPSFSFTISAASCSINAALILWMRTINIYIISLRVCMRTVKPKNVITCTCIINPIWQYFFSFLPSQKRNCWHYRKVLWIYVYERLRGIFYTLFYVFFFYFLFMFLYFDDLIVWTCLEFMVRINLI